MGLGGGPARGWHRQDRLTHSHTVTHKWYASRPPTPTLTPSASSCPNVVLPMPNSKGAEHQELEVPSVSAMCPAAKLVQDQALLATQPPGQPPDSHDSDTGCLRYAPRPRHGRQNHASTPPSSSCLTLPYPGILQGTYHMATRPYRRRTTNGPTSLRPCFPTSSPPPASAPHASVAFVLFIVLT